MELSKEQMAYLLANSWKVSRVDTHLRDEVVNTTGWALLEYGDNNTFSYGGKSGDWKLIENKYFEYRFYRPEDEARLNFGGIYAVVNLTDTTLTLAKVLSSTQDMKRIIYLYQSDYYNSKLLTNLENHYRGNLSKKVLDSISHLSEELLLKAGFYSGLYLVGDTILINTQDAVYKIKRMNSSDEK